MLLKIPTCGLRMFCTEPVFLEHGYFGVLVSFFFFYYFINYFYRQKKKL